MKSSIASVVAERRLELSSGPTVHDVCVFLGVPLRSQDKQDYSCEIQILGLGDDEVHRIYGFDSMQALQLALKFISTQLDSHRRNLRWCGDRDIGF